MSLIRISLTFTFSFFSNGLVKYQCPSWPALGSITEFSSFQEFEKRMNRFLQDNIKASLEYPESPFYLFPENIWHFQTNRPIPGKTTLNVPVNANLHENYNQDQTLFPIDVYYLTYSEHETFYVLWIPLIEKFVQEHNSRRNQKNCLRSYKRKMARRSC